jgi:hypothetical protein
MVDKELERSRCGISKYNPGVCVDGSRKCRKTKEVACTPVENRTEHLMKNIGATQTCTLRTHVNDTLVIFALIILK